MPVLTLTDSDARTLTELLEDLQAYCATNAQALDRIHKAPIAAARLLEVAVFVANIREKLASVSK